MKLSEVKKTLDAQVLAGEDMLDKEIHSACGSDLLSDVLAFVKDQALLLTGLVNTQVVRTAEMMDIKAIAFVRGKQPNEEIIELANEFGIVVMTTQLPLYAACGSLYLGGLRSQKKGE